MLIRSNRMLHLILAALLTTYVAPNPPFSRHDVAIAGDAQHALVAWTQFDNGSMRVHVSPLGSSRDVVLPITGQLQMSPAIAFDGVNYLVVWAEVDFRTTTSYAARVSGSGDLLDQTPIRLGNSRTDSCRAPDGLPTSIARAPARSSPASTPPACACWYRCPRRSSERQRRQRLAGEVEQRHRRRIARCV